jgi:Domain of unknown function (DUF4160)
LARRRHHRPLTKEISSHLPRRQVADLEQAKSAGSIQAACRASLLPRQSFVYPTLLHPARCAAIPPPFSFRRSPGAQRRAGRIPLSRHPLLFLLERGQSREPLHIRALRGDAEAKFWLAPTVRVASSNGFDARTLAELTKVVERHRTVIQEAWHDHFG